MSRLICNVCEVEIPPHGPDFLCARCKLFAPPKLLERWYAASREVRAARRTAPGEPTPSKLRRKLITAYTKCRDAARAAAERGRIAA